MPSRTTTDGAKTQTRDIPCSKLEAQLTLSALGPYTNLHILDLGGGSGLHARRAISAGAASVDVLDISVEMKKIGQDIEAQLGRGPGTGKEKTRWFAADLSRPLSEQDVHAELRSEGYDVDLRAIWGNVVAYLKPVGKFLGVRVQNVRAEYMARGKYGVTFTEVEEIPGGLAYNCNCLTEPPFSFGATSMEETYKLEDTIPRELGLVGIEAVNPEETEVVKGDVEFWKDFVADPNLTVVVMGKP
ncbi:hypothetical protein B0T16DRAFT_395311 [Cercophora newfieldiana]|uniref:Methyltransferase domain-containing protein n=1 Tax=Cercophora newfieldiana TaxID=92897 RepID=A0AA39XSV0_9PEZI|nr:hypothetical protein B0T16DRAFT_395311 [Cercophora newfieldiana]